MISVQFLHGFRCSINETDSHINLVHYSFAEAIIM